MRPISLRPTTPNRAANQSSGFAWISTLTPDLRGDSGVLTPPLPIGAARERLFEGLDGQVLSAVGRDWHVRVYSIWDEKGSWWLQLALEGDPEYTVTMRTPFGDNGAEALRKLANWLADPTTSHDSLSAV